MDSPKSPLPQPEPNLATKDIDPETPILAGASEVKREPSPSSETLSASKSIASVTLVPIVVAVLIGSYQIAPTRTLKFVVIGLGLGYIAFLWIVLKYRMSPSVPICGSIVLAVAALVVGLDPFSSAPSPTGQATRAPESTPTSHLSALTPATPTLDSPSLASWSGSVKDKDGQFQLNVRIEYTVQGSTRRWATLYYRVDGPARSPVSVDWRSRVGPEDNLTVIEQGERRGVVEIGKQYEQKLTKSSPVADREQMTVSFTLDLENGSKKRWYNVNYVD